MTLNAIDPQALDETTLRAHIDEFRADAILVSQIITQRDVNMMYIIGPGHGQPLSKGEKARPKPGGPLHE